MIATDFLDTTEKKLLDTNYKLLLEKYYKGLSHDFSLFKRVPFLVNDDLLIEFQRLIKILNTVLKKIVLNYFENERIQQLFDLDEELENILKLGVSIPYEVGMYRPDILFDKQGRPKICEIGCRYPINGWMISYYMNEILQEVYALYSKCKPISHQTNLIKEIANSFHKNELIYYVHNKEKGTEAYLFFDELNKLGYKIKDVSPNDFYVITEKLMVGENRATQFILEMDREELKDIDAEVLKHLIRSEKCINDIRTIILVHDKRILSVLYDAEVMKSFISTEDYTFLKKFLIPSYPLIDENLINTLKTTNDNWILKKSSGGRGIDMYVKDETTKEEWHRILDNERSNYMVQQYVDQQVYTFENQELHMVGMLLAYNEKSYGLGIYRGSGESVINVHSGAYIFPSAVKR
ncbi:hypothetical protein [uncultured Tenacibaculum sp.]|uniref:hypothetical protein n=1 Tax=uncultured Tenacibaculum sp. TaxID=174713 RepID=UPI002617F643|nr:hypothetical protein [uncultured Tenacibaculum sp.]